MRPVIALVGRPNVGKSTLFNRLTRSREALVANIPGLTRDRKYGDGKIEEQSFIVIDTGGFEPVTKEGILAHMAKQTTQAIAEADVVLATMLFLDDHIRMILPALEARREDCDAMVCLMSAGEGVRLAKCKTVNLGVPSHSEVVLEGTITPGEELADGPFGDHMGFYGGVEASPLVRFHCVTQRRNPVFLTTFSGRPPKEDAMLAIALNRIYTPILRQQIPEIVDFFLPMEGLSYKLAVIAIDKAYPGQAKRAAMAFWSALPQFTYTKFVVVVDKSINIRDPRQVIWAISAQVDPQRDLFVLEDTPFDSLDFASERLGLGGRLAIDATTKIGPEKRHPWGEPLSRPAELEARLDARWAELGLADIGKDEPDPALFGYTLEHVLERLAGRATAKA